MNEFEQKRRIRKILYSPLTLIPFTILLLFLMRGTWNIYEKNRSSSVELNASNDRLVKLQGRQTELNGMIGKLNTESGVEGEIRDRFQMAKAGEQEVVIVEPDKNQNSTTTSSEPGFLQKIWNFFTIK